MNKTEYMNTLKEELRDLPAEVIEETMRFYENQFSEGLAEGKSEIDIANVLPKPRLVAAQKKAGAQYQQFKKKITPNHFASLMISLMGVLVFNFFMIIPAIMYAVVLFVTYLASFALYGAGTVMIASSLSGVPQMQVTLPGHHHHHHHRNSFHHQIEEAAEKDHGPMSTIVDELNSNEHQQANHVSINLNDNGIVVVKEDGQIRKVLELNDSDQVFQNHRREKHTHTITIKNKLQKHHAFYGFGILLAGIGLLIFCLFMTKMTFVWFKQYLLWNLSLLRSPLKSA